VLLPEFGGTSLKLKDEEYVIYREDDILAVVKE
jgi:co-chaperonin GroES (HSP10)